MMMMVEGIKPNGGGGGNGNGGRIVVVDDDMADGMQCTDHPYRNNPGGICAFCLQEKLGKLVSSSFPLPIRGSSSSSSSPSFRSDIASVAGGVGPSSSSARVTAAGLSLSLSVRPGSSSLSSLNKGGNDCRFMDQQEYYNSNNNNNNNSNHTRRARLPFLLAKKKKKVSNTGTTSSGGDNAVVFKRSKSTTTPSGGSKFLDHHQHEDFVSPRKHRGGFWSFLYLSSSSTTTTTSSCSTKSATTTASRKIDHNGSKTASFSSVTSAGLANTKQKERCLGSSISVVEEDNDMSSPNSQTTASASSFERKVSRSRSVGCGSRSFSGDFFERISTGFGDCTLRRVESQREGKPKSSSAAAHRGGAGAGGGDHHCMKERVRCGGIFGGFILTSSSSSSSSSSYWVSSSAEEMNGKSVAGGTGPGAGPLSHGRSRSWGWAFASPMRAFGKPNSFNGKRDITRQASDKNSTTTPNLAAIPSLLAVRS